MAAALEQQADECLGGVEDLAAELTAQAALAEAREVATNVAVDKLVSRLDAVEVQASVDAALCQVETRTLRNGLHFTATQVSTCPNCRQFLFACNAMHGR
eukprot:SAG31_NODE_3663_length_4010_cov_4.327330_4_plen_100_part_00